MAGLGGGAGYRPKVVCADCAHHKLIPVRRLFGGFRDTHKCFVDFETRHCITGEPMRRIADCEAAWNSEVCHFQAKGS